MIVKRRRGTIEKPEMSNLPCQSPLTYAVRWESLQGERDGVVDGSASGVKPLAVSILERFYSLAYRHGYHRGYATAQSSKRGAKLEER